MADDHATADATARSTWRDELLTFLTLTVVIAPALAVGIVGFYGLCVWLYQAFTGPPGPPVG
jgi:nitrate reductase NapE